MDHILSIRAVQPDESHLLLEYIFMLAKHQNAEEKVSVDASRLKIDLESNWFDAYFLTLDEKIIGSCILYWQYSSWKGRSLFIDELIIHPDYRRAGYGQKMFDYILKLAKSKDCRLLQWSIDPKNDEAIAFYRKNNAVISQNWLDGTLVLAGT